MRVSSVALAFLALSSSMLLISRTASAEGADGEKAAKEESTEKTEKTGSEGEKASGDKTEKTEAKPEPRVRGPADNLVVEASIGYGAGVFGAIEGHDPKVAHGPMFHAGLGYAWTLRRNQSLGVAATIDGMVDGDGSTGAGAALSARYGGSAFMYGEKAHLRLGFGYAKAKLDGADFSGIGVGFAVGYHGAMGDRDAWKRAAITFDVVPSWDFLGAGGQTLHRWTFGLLFGVSVI